MNPERRERLHTIVEGNVQGVGFRFFVSEKAKELRLNGWVRNTLKGQVEVLAEGNRDDLEKLLSYLYRGPGSGYVARIVPEWRDATGEFYRFYIKPTL